MNTRTIEETLTKQALELKNGNDEQKKIGQQVAALALELEVNRKANEKPWDKDTHGPPVKQSPNRIEVPKKLKSEDY